MKVVLNRGIGGFALSKEAAEWLGLEWDGYGFFDYDQRRRADPKLVACIEALGEKADGYCAELEVIEIPEGIAWYIKDNDDGSEYVQEFGHIWPEKEEEFWKNILYNET